MIASVTPAAAPIIRLDCDELARHSSSRCSRISCLKRIGTEQAAPGRRGRPATNQHGGQKNDNGCTDAQS